MIHPTLAPSSIPRGRTNRTSRPVVRVWRCGIAEIAVLAAMATLAVGLRAVAFLG
ncbi:hypothetical protein ABLE93_14675 [Xanthobacter sp. KR7-65]|uniref:hypothetical protein n=1 Tax=Xanthobacter sp. KR7-65 TaxID=3156612 RepID=UPI0032B3265A